jgi:hypothetical protein
MAGDSLQFADRYGQARLRALAAVLSEKRNKTVHRLKPGGIDHAAAVAPNSDKSSEAEAVEMKGERVGSEAELFGNLPGGHAFRPGLDQQAEDFQAVFLSKRGQRCDGT